MFKTLIIFAVILGAACSMEQTPPLPYAVMTKEPGLLGGITAQSGVEVAAPEGVSAALAKPLAEALAAALREQDIAALANQALTGGQRISGAAQIRNDTLWLDWKLLKPDGSLISQFETQEALPAGATAESVAPSILEALAARAASAFVPHLGASEPHAPALQVLAPDIPAAPGDSGKTLPQALRGALRAAGLTIMDAPAANVITITGSVQVSDLDADSELVSLSWRVTAPDGAEIGRIDQSNPIPRGQTQGNWGALAYAAAAGAAEGIIPLLEDYRDMPR